MVYPAILLLHLLGACIWVGGHIVLAGIILPQALRVRDPAILLAFESRFERIGMPALLVQVASGLWLAAQWLPDHVALLALDSAAAHAIAAKLGLLAATVGLAANARLRVIPRLSAETLPLMAAHVFAVTLLGVLFVAAGAGLRTGAAP